jgi:dipeptidyl aminopeptidase/acylaminoacyl peptidase
LADSINGKNEKMLASRPNPIRIGDNAFSPDGNSVAFAVGQSENQANEFVLAKIDLATSVESEIATEKFFNIRNITWLPDASGLLFTASRILDKTGRIWHVSVATGEAKQVTKDSHSYRAISLDNQGRRLVTTRYKQDFRLRLFNLDNLVGVPQLLVDGSSVSFAPNGEILFSSEMSGNEEIWSIDPGSGERSQLTNDRAREEFPIVSSDNTSIYFMSNRGGEAHVWRMSRDGSNQTQLTTKVGGYPLSISYDGKWVYYHSGRDRTLWRVSTTTGNEELLIDKRKQDFAISPDGSQAAFQEKENGETILVIMSVLDGRTVKTFPLAMKGARIARLYWPPNANNLSYVLINSNERKILWLQPLDASSPRQIADLGSEALSDRSSLAFSSDGRQVVVAQGGWKHDAVLISGLK